MVMLSFVSSPDTSTSEESNKHLINKEKGIAVRPIILPSEVSAIIVTSIGTIISATLMVDFMKCLQRKK